MNKNVDGGVAIKIDATHERRARAMEQAFSLRKRGNIANFLFFVG
jgi:hypothetical protein